MASANQRVRHIRIGNVLTDVTDPNPDEQTYSLALGSEIGEGTDLFTVKSVGNYFSPSNERTATLTNCPVTGEPFRMVCGYLLDSDRPYLLIRTDSGNLYTTAYDGEEYSGWKSMGSGSTVYSDSEPSVKQNEGDVWKQVLSTVKG